ncbi:hypothetical protein Pcinc_000952 [Petrolisthes cinctipes]|uniref:Profilin n=1 Tax=Petrolisthes cinctipes TaxID=88211 RepID=A0AAE1GRQ8_PETCI|nr:hypothetical protein Pcinc_000952 [Petrolisthes cinctipes]
MGHDGSCWASSAGFTIQPTEVQALLKGFASADALQSSGLHVAGEKYFFIGSGDSFIRGKKGQNGIHASKTNQAIIIGYYDDSIQPGTCTTEVEKVADYLKGQNY